MFLSSWKLFELIKFLVIKIVNVLQYVIVMFCFRALTLELQLGCLLDDRWFILLCNLNKTVKQTVFYMQQTSWIQTKSSKTSNSQDRCNNCYFLKMYN